MPITDESKEKLKARLAKAMGHLNAVHRMVDEKKYCVDVLHQMKAVQAALDKISEEILRQHLETCVVDALKTQDTTRVVEELLEVFRRAPELDLDELQTMGLQQGVQGKQTLPPEKALVGAASKASSTTSCCP